MFSYAKRVGRLVEIRATGLPTPEHVALLRRSMLENLKMLGADEKLIVFTDLRGAKALPAALAEEVATMLRATNTRLIRAALIIDDPVTRMQAQRVLEGAKGDHRKMCKDAAEAEAWLAPVCDAGELERLRVVLGEK